MAVTTDVRRAPAPRPPSGRPALAGFTLLLIAALAAAVANQGAYYGAGQWPVLLLVGAAFVGAVRAVPWSRLDARVPPLGLCLALAAWALLRGALAGDMAAALPIVAILAGTVAVVATARRTSRGDVLASAVVAVGALVAATGWIGVAWRVSPWALEDQRLWRAATSLTYANAAGGLLAALVLLALGRLVGRRPSPLERATLCLLLVGLGATLSRGGIAAAGVGMLVLLAVLGLRPVARAAAAPGLGAVVALAGLAPSMPAASPSRPLVAVLALAAGLAVAAGAPLLSGSLRRRPVVVALLAGGAALVLALVAAQSLTAVGSTRLTLASPDRQDEARAALRLAADNPVGGVGPGQAPLRWVGADGNTLVAKYAHNEYLQVLAELGAVGLALVLGLIALSAREIRAGRRGAPPRPLRSGAVAGLVALLVGSGLDFLWHVPAIPLFAAVLVAFTVPNRERSTK